MISTKAAEIGQDLRRSLRAIAALERIGNHRLARSSKSWPRANPQPQSLSKPRPRWLVAYGNDNLDHRNKWANRLGVESLWQRLPAEATPL
jgi:hypothetical protein